MLYTLRRKMNSMFACDSNEISMTIFKGKKNIKIDYTKMFVQPN